MSKNIGQRALNGFAPGGDLLLDQAIRIVPRIYESLSQSRDSEPSNDAFMELAATLRAELRDGDNRSSGPA